MTKQVQVCSRRGSRRGRSSGKARTSLLPFFAPFNPSVLEPSLQEKSFSFGKWLPSGNCGML